MSIDIALYTRRPINVAAVQVTDENCYDVAKWLYENETQVEIYPAQARLIMYTPQKATVKFGCWIMRLDGRFQACSDEYFHKNYAGFDPFKETE